MKLTALFGLWITTWVAVAAGEEPQSFVRFANGDQLGGSLQGLAPGVLVWSSPVLTKPSPFFLKQVLELSLPGSAPKDNADHVATIALTNGDTVRGQLVSVTDQSVVLDTWFAGRMSFNRRMVSGVKIDGRTNYQYRGPTGMDGWIQSGGKPAWTFRNGAFFSNAPGGIARDGTLPEECAVRFDVGWRSETFGLKVIIFSNEPKADSTTSGYDVTFQRSSIYLRNCRTQNFVGSTHVQAFMENQKVRIEFRASRKSGKICLFVNGEIQEVWTDPDVGKGRFGDCLHFVAHNTQPVKISGIEVTPWDGMVERLPEPRPGMMNQFGIQGRAGAAPPPKEKSKEGRMELANGDTLAGEVAAIENGIISVKSTLGEVKLPVARLRSVALTKTELERCKRMEGDVRGWFADGTSLVFRLDGLNQGNLTGFSQNFGNASFKLAGLRRIEFNLYDHELEGKRANDDW